MDQTTDTTDTTVDPLTFSDLRAIAALTLYRHGADATDAQLRAVAALDRDPDYPALTDGELGWIRNYLHRAVITIDGTTYGAEE